MQKSSRLSVIINHLLLGDQQIHAQWDESPLAQILLTIRRVPAGQQCMACFEKYHPTRAEVACPHCGSAGAKIIAGKEFYLESIEE